MKNNRILTIQDISCVGQCSLTVALPILSACGLETAVLPSAVLSTHTAGFTGYTFRDLTEDMDAIRAHWEKENLRFDAVYTGYLGSREQIGHVKRIVASLCRSEGILIVDPAMADNGRLYPGFDAAFVEEMKALCAEADYLLPNITEACFLSGMPYRESYDEDYIRQLLAAVCANERQTVVLTGVSYSADTTGVVVYQAGELQYYRHPKHPKGCHGTGDVYASAFTGALLRGRSAFDSARIAADYTLCCIRYTANDPDHWYGVRFEPVLPALMESLPEKGGDALPL